MATVQSGKGDAEASPFRGTGWDGPCTTQPESGCRAVSGLMG